MGFFKELDKICETAWAEVTGWSWFAQRTVGMQLVRALDSADANIAESEGRWHPKEQIRHLYIARGSIAEALRWLSKASQRKLFRGMESHGLIEKLESVHRQLNGIINYRRKRVEGKAPDAS